MKESTTKNNTEQWEYEMYVILSRTTGHKVREGMDFLGAQGWELVSVVGGLQGGYAFFKRKKKEEKDTSFLETM